MLAPVLILLAFQTAPEVDTEPASDPYLLLHALAVFNVVMLVFNLLPVYPLDGGRVLHAVLWPVLGRGPALAAAAVVGLVAAVGLGVVAFAAGEMQLTALAGFLVLGALGGLGGSRMLARLKVADRRPGLACPNCRAAPPVGTFWRCTRCFQPVDLFGPATACAKGGGHAVDGACPECGCPVGAGEWAAAGEETPGLTDARDVR